jgi:hypothetical protein
MGVTEDKIRLEFSPDGESVDVNWQWGQFPVNFSAHVAE